MKNNTFRFIICMIVILSLVSCASRKISQSQPQSSAPAFHYYYDALSNIEQGQLNLALANLDTAIQLRPEFAQFYYVKGQVSELLKDDGQAIRAYEKALAYKSFFPEVWNHLSNLYMQTGRYQEAVELLKELTAHQPDSVDFDLRLADAYLSTGQCGLALDRIKYYQARGGASPDVDRIKGLAYYGERKYQNTVDFLQPYAEAHPGNFQVQKALGIACIKTGALEKGISHLNMALGMNPDDPEIYLYRARYFIQRNKFPMAMDQLNFALSLDSTNCEILLEKGKFELSRRDTLLAESFFKKALIADSSCCDCYKYLGIIQDDLGNSIEAKLYLEHYMNNIYTKDPEVEKRLERLRRSAR